MKFSIPIRDVHAASTPRLWRRYKVVLSWLVESAHERVDRSNADRHVEGFRRELAEAERLGTELVRRAQLTQEALERQLNAASAGWDSILAEEGLVRRRG